MQKPAHLIQQAFIHIIYIRIQHIPHLALAVLVMQPLGHLIIWMHLNREVTR